MAGFGALLTYLFFLYHRKKKKKILYTLTNSDFISKCTNYIYIYIFPMDNFFAADLSTG